MVNKDKYTFKFLTSPWQHTAYSHHIHTV